MKIHLFKHSREQYWEVSRLGETYIGELHVDWGSMFSGKTESLIRRVRRAEYANKKVQVFKPRIDNRYGDTAVITHVGDKIEATIVDNSTQLAVALSHDTDLVAIDEVQFFDDGIIEAIRAMKRHMGIDVVVSGLDMWSTGEPVLLTAHLAAIANTVEKHNAVCVDTGRDAYVSYAMIEKESDVVVGGSESYIPVCEEAFLKREQGIY